MQLLHLFYGTVDDCVRESCKKICFRDLNSLRFISFGHNIQYMARIGTGTMTHVVKKCVIGMNGHKIAIICETSRKYRQSKVLRNTTRIRQLFLFENSILHIIFLWDFYIISMGDKQRQS